MLVRGWVNPSVKFAGTRFYTWVEIGEGVSPKNTTQPGLEHGPLDMVVSALTMRPPHQLK